jgi:hypothetical protein
MLRTFIVKHTYSTTSKACYNINSAINVKLISSHIDSLNPYLGVTNDCSFNEVNNKFRKIELQHPIPAALYKTAITVSYGSMATPFFFFNYRPCMFTMSQSNNALSTATSSQCGQSAALSYLAWNEFD